MTNKDYYKILQVDPLAEPEVIAGAYRRLALKYHPDTNKSVDSRRMVEINEAYEVLSDPTKRRKYDRKRLRERQGSRERQASATKSTESSTSGQKLVYQSDFYYATDSFEDVGENSRSFCQDGYFHLAIQTLSDYWLRYQYFRPAVDDFRVSVEAQFAANTGKNSECGIVFRFQDDSSFYRFGVNSHGCYRLHASHSSGWKTLLDWRFSESLTRGSAVNTLSVMAVGSRIQLGANGHSLSSVEDSSLSHGVVGVFLAAKDCFAEVRFRDVRLYSLDAASYQGSGSQYQADTEQAERGNTSQCPNCGAPVFRYWSVAGGESVSVLICEECGWSY